MSAAGPGPIASASSMKRTKAGWRSSALLRRVTADHGECRASDRFEGCGVDRSDAVQRRGEEADKGSWIVVMGVERDPRHGASLLGCGLCQERGLAIPGGRRDGHESRGRGG